MCRREQNRSFATSGSTPDGTCNLVVRHRDVAPRRQSVVPHSGYLVGERVPKLITEGRSEPHHHRIGRRRLDRPPGRRALQAAALMALDRPCRRDGAVRVMPQLPETAVSANLNVCACAEIN
jgi:hypothetical protein